MLAVAGELELDRAVVEAQHAGHALEVPQRLLELVADQRPGRAADVALVGTAVLEGVLVERALVGALVGARHLRGHAVDRADEREPEDAVGVVREVVAQRRGGVDRHDPGVAGLADPLLEVVVVGQRRLRRVVGDGLGDLVGLRDHRPVAVDGPAALVRPGAVLDRLETLLGGVGVLDLDHEDGGGRVGARCPRPRPRRAHPATARCRPRSRGRRSRARRGSRRRSPCGCRRRCRCRPRPRRRGTC